jgi:hypothetical protein
MGNQGEWVAMCDAAETGRPHYDGKVGSAVAGRMRVAASQATALGRRLDVVPKVRKALMGRTNGLLGGGGGGAGGGGDARPDLALLTTFSPVFFFSCVIKSG